MIESPTQSPSHTTAAEPLDDLRLTGSLRGLLLFDISESIDLGKLHRLLGTHPSRREPAFRQPAPEYVRYERPPVIQQLGTRQVQAGNDPEASTSSFDVRVRYFDYGVASVELRRSFTATWDELAQVAQRWANSTELEAFAHSLLREALDSNTAALIKPHREWINEDYFVVQLDPITTAEARQMSAEEVLARWGREIARIVRGEEAYLSASETKEVLQSSMSYYPSDLLVLGWVAAFVYDKRSDASTTIDLLEYANTQLLEFRYYDDVLTNVLEGVYKRLERRHSMWDRWSMARQAHSLNTIRLDYQELLERTQNAIKFLGDMFYARVYRLAAARIGVNDYRDLVNGKLDTARDLYQTLVNEFHQGRAFFLELAVVIILIVEIVFLFLGHRS